MKRPIALLLLSLLLMGLSACGPVLAPARADLVPTPAVSPTPAPTPRPTPRPTPTPTPTPVPTPTPDPMDRYFAADGQQIIRQDFTTWDAWLYQDHDLCVEIHKFVDAEARQTYYVADIRVRNGVVLTSGFPNAERPGRCGTRLPYKLARQYKAVYAQNGDFLLEEKETKGILIKNGTLVYEGNRQDTLALMPDGAMRVYSPGEITAAELMDMGVMNTFSFGPTLIRDGQVNPDMNKHRVAKLKNPRSALGMVEPGHYIAIVVEGRDEKRSVGMTCEELAALFLSYGCTVAYNLDGGASSSMVFMGNSLITHETYYFGQRSVPDILMVGVCDQVPDVNAPTQYTGIGEHCPVTPSPTPEQTPTAAPTVPPAVTDPPPPPPPVTEEPPPTDPPTPTPDPPPTADPVTPEPAAADTPAPAPGDTAAAGGGAGPA